MVKKLVEAAEVSDRGPVTVISLADVYIGHRKSATLEHAGTSTNRRQQIADIDLVKNSTQRATTLSWIRASRRGRPPTPPTAVAVGDVGGRMAGGVWDFKGQCDARCQARPL